MQALSGSQRKYLRGLAHSLKPVGHIGKNGLSESLILSLAESLRHHELIKVRFVDHQDEKKELCAAISERLDCAQVGTIGHVAMFYRPADDVEDRRIALPKRGTPRDRVS